jgi:hypothetical protein
MSVRMASLIAVPGRDARQPESRRGGRSRNFAIGCGCNNPDRRTSIEITDRAASPLVGRVLSLKRQPPRWRFFLRARHLPMFVGST